jgi:hypothetical protein
MGLVAIPASAYYFAYSGSECELTTGGTREVSEFGAVLNTHSTSDMGVVCPAKFVGDTIDISEATMVVQDRSASENISCTLTCRDTDSAGSEYTSTDSSSGTGDFQALDFAGVYFYASGACFIACSIPNIGNTGTDVSGIHSYTVYQQ